MGPGVVEEFWGQGFVVLPAVVAQDDVAAIRARSDALVSASAGEEQIVEADGKPCSVYVRRNDPVYAALAGNPGLLGAVRRILGGDVYVHQCKFNDKVAFTGSELFWHRDLAYWKALDDIPGDRILTAAILLDVVTPLNAPLLLIERSHLQGACPAAGACVPSSEESGSGRSGVAASWEAAERLGDATVVAPLRFRIPHAELERMVRTAGIFSFTGQPGDVALFHGAVAHGSAANMSPWGRRVAFITYNRVDNRPPPGPSRRADFICNPDPTPVVESLRTPAAVWSRM